MKTFLISIAITFAMLTVVMANKVYLDYAAERDGIAAIIEGASK